MHRRNLEIDDSIRVWLGIGLSEDIIIAAGRVLVPTTRRQALTMDGSPWKGRLRRRPDEAGAAAAAAAVILPPAANPAAAAAAAAAAHRLPPALAAATAVPVPAAWPGRWLARLELAASAVSPARPRRQVAALALASRVVVSALSVAANLALPDHRADGVRVFSPDRFGFDRCASGPGPVCSPSSGCAPNSHA